MEWETLTTKLRFTVITVSLHAVWCESETIVPSNIHKCLPWNASTSATNYRKEPRGSVKAALRQALNLNICRFSFFAE